MVEVLETFANASPNPGHVALARMERTGFVRGVITQNIDNLHQDAGSTVVDEIHGNLFRFTCYRCKHKSQLDRAALSSIVTEIAAATPGRIGLMRLLRAKLLRCPVCGGTRRPDVVFFGEALPQEAWNSAVLMAATCKVILVVGTSGLVYPAAEVPRVAARKGAAVIEINPHESPITHLAEVHVPEGAGKALNIIGEMLLSFNH